jgi:uncharacterized protein (TIGR02118 family)
MYKLMVIFHLSHDILELEKQWSENFVAHAEKMPGLRRVSVSRVRGSLMEQTRIHLVHELFFDDETALRQALASSEGQTAGRALMEFAADNLTLLMAEHLEEARGESPRGGNARVLPQGCAGLDD